MDITIEAVNKRTKQKQAFEITGVANRDPKEVLKEFDAARTKTHEAGKITKTSADVALDEELPDTRKPETLTPETLQHQAAADTKTFADVVAKSASPKTPAEPVK